MPRLAKAHSTALKLVLTVVLLAFLIHVVGWRDLMAGLSAARWSWLVAMYTMALLSYAVTSASLHYLLSKSGVEISLGRVLLVNALSNLYSLILPGDLMVGASKWVMLSAATGQRVKAFSAIVFNKIALGLPLLLFGTLAPIFDSPFPQLPVGEAAVAGASVVVASLVLVFNARAGQFFDKWIRGASRVFPVRVQSIIGKLLESLAGFRALGIRDRLQVLVLCSLAYGFLILSFLCATRALGLGVPIPTLFWTSLALFVARLLPITFSNLGVREGVLILAFGTIQVEPALALGVGLLMFTSTIGVGLLGAVCQIAVALGWLKLTDAEAHAASERGSPDLGAPD